MPTYTPLRRKIRHSLAAGSFSWLPPQGATNVDILLIGGGGGGGGSGGTVGGNGGAVLQAQWVPTPGTTYTLTVGAGGTGGAAPTAGADTIINDSVDDIFTAEGGGISQAALQDGFTLIAVRTDINALHIESGALSGTGNSDGIDSEFADGGNARSGNGGGASWNDGGQGAPGVSNHGGGGGFDLGVDATNTANDHGDGGDGRLILTYRLGSDMADNVPT